jgi:hypothetical protein
LAAHREERGQRDDGSWRQRRADRWWWTQEEDEGLGHNGPVKKSLRVERKWGAKFIFQIRITILSLKARV